MTRLIVEKREHFDEMDYVLYEHCDCGSFCPGRDELGVSFCQDRFEQLFPAFKQMRAGDSVEVDVSIKQVGNAAPWDEWEWVGKKK